jgi:chemotaxis signal transduction protein
MAEQWRAGLVNLREIMTNVINLGALTKISSD